MRLMGPVAAVALLLATVVLAHCTNKTKASDTANAFAPTQRIDRTLVDAERSDGKPPHGLAMPTRHDTSDVFPSWEEVTRRCSELDDGAIAGSLSSRCMSTLDAWFLDQAVTPSVLPDANPIRWRDVFVGLRKNVDIVKTALADRSCFVPVGDIRPELEVRCGARAMVELQVAMDVCSNVEDEQSYMVVIDDSRHSTRGVDHYLSKVWPVHWKDAVDEIDRVSADQTTYWEDRRRLTNARYRTEWTLARCFSALSELPDRQTRSSTFPPLLPLAARYGDRFANANYPDPTDPNPAEDQQHLAALLQRDPLQAFIHYAGLYRGWGDRLARSIHLGRLVGSEELLHELLGLRLDESATPQEIDVSLRRRSEYLALKYVLAAKSLAEVTGVSMSLDMLDKSLKSEVPSMLDENDYSLAKFEAEQLVGEYRPSR